MKISTRKIKSLMGAALLTQKQLAADAQVSRATLNNALLKGSCSTETVGKVAKALGVSVEQILEDE